jgi:hypothetical protein
MLLTDRLILSGFGRATMAPYYSDTSFGLTLTYSFAPRSGLFSGELPDSIFQPFR